MDEEENNFEKDIKKIEKISFPSDIYMSNPEIPAGGRWEVTKKDFEEITDKKNFLISVRGMILDSASSIERLFNGVIMNILFRENLQKLTPEKIFFKEEILESDFFTFMNKWKIFRGLCHNSILLKDKDLSNLRKNIHNLIETRDKFAHGTIIFKEAKYPYLEYYSNGKKEIELTSPYFMELVNLFNRVFNDLFKLNSDLLNNKL